jgi:hypothetical protein
MLESWENTVTAPTMATIIKSVAMTTLQPSVPEPTMLTSPYPTVDIVALAK